MVVVLRWPAEAVRRDELAASGIPRLLLVEHGSTPPQVQLGLEDWLRVPADERDMFLRIARLQRRYDADAAARLKLDDLVLRSNDRWVALSPIEAGLMVPLIAKFGELVTYETLGSAWDDGVARSLRTRIRYLRSRLAEVGLRLTTVRGRGFILEPDTEEAE